MSHFGTTDFFVEVARGNIPGHTMLMSMGERESMGTPVNGEDIWRGNELSPAPTSTEVIPMPPDIGEQMTVVSEDANDTAAGTGIRTLDMHYLDAAGNEQEETITMNGTTTVNTVATDIRFVQDLHAVTVGANGVAAGHIKIYSTGDSGLVYNMISEGGNKSLVPHRMVPRNKSFILVAWHAEEAQGKRVAFRIRSTDMNGVLLPGVFCFKGVVYMKQDTSGELHSYIYIPALSVVKVSGWPDQAGAEGSCCYWGVLIDDNV